jgi:hypothetical protein
MQVNQGSEIAFAVWEISEKGRGHGRFAVLTLIVSGVPAYSRAKDQQII